jgi:hypothetical protein
MTVRTQTLRLSADDRAASPYLQVPFEVPEGAGSLELHLDYDRSLGVLDLGCEGPHGFRGWSGGARSHVVIAADAATPGYLPGRPEPGTWSVVLGLHRVPEEGLQARVRVTVPATAGPPAEPEPPLVPQRRPRRDLPAAPGLTWYAADLHAHTLHSDGSLTIPELAAAAVAAGLDVLAVTDHNTVSHHPHLPGVGARFGLTLLPGQEITTDRGHANAFGDIGWVDFRRPAREWQAEVSRRGGLLSVNHPLAADCAWQHDMPERPALAEIWHWTWLDPTWTAPLAWWMAWDPGTVPVGGSDFHDPAQGRPLAVPVTWVACEGEPDVDTVMDALRCGRTAVAAGIDTPVLLRVEDDLVAVGADGALLTDAEGRRTRVRGDLVRLPGREGPHRLETPLAAVLAITA